MSEIKFNATIQETGDGIQPYYQVQIAFVPRVGEFIDLYSFVEQAGNRPPNRNYEVIKVVHRIHDVTDRFSVSREGSHFVQIFVKLSDQEFPPFIP